VEEIEVLAAGGVVEQGTPQVEQNAGDEVAHGEARVHQ
jgi:hypothetical protein